MVKTLEKAIRIQQRRKAAGKIGIAKAVQRFIKRTGIKLDCSFPVLTVEGQIAKALSGSR